MIPSRGFTLIEIMVTLAITTIFVMLAAPSLSQFLSGNRLTSSVDEFKKVLQSARGEAIKRNVAIGMASMSSRPDSHNEWGEGVRLWVDTDGDNVYDSGFNSGELLLQEFTPPNGVRIDANPNFTALNYRPTGRVGVVGGNSTYSFDFCVTGKSDGVTILLSTSSATIQRSTKDDCPTS